MLLQADRDSTIADFKNKGRISSLAYRPTRFLRAGTEGWVYLYQWETILLFPVLRDGYVCTSGKHPDRDVARGTWPRRQRSQPRKLTIICFAVDDKTDSSRKCTVLLRVLRSLPSYVQCFSPKSTDLWKKSNTHKPQTRHD